MLVEVQTHPCDGHPCFLCNSPGTQDAMQQMKDVLGDNPAGQRIYALWREYEDAATPEAKAAKGRLLF